MKLSERIRYLCDKTHVSQSRVAKFIGISQSSFNQWLNPKSEKNFFPHLPKILELFPDVRPEWLYMGQEPAFKDGTEVGKVFTAEEVGALQEEIERLKSELAEADRINRKLTAKFLVDGVTDEKDSGAIVKAAGQE